MRLPANRFLIHVLYAILHLRSAISESEETYPVCSEVIYTGAKPHVENTIFNCINKNVSSNSMPPSYMSGIPTVVNASVGLINIVGITETNSEVTINLFFDLIWRDPRLNLDPLWEALNKTNPLVLTEGVELSGSVFTADAPLLPWLPDTTFIDATAKELVAQSFRLFPDRRIYWERHMRMTLSQTHFDYNHFPEDNQEIIVRFENLALTKDLVSLQFHDEFPEAVWFVKDKDSSAHSEDESKDFFDTQEWYYKGVRVAMTQYNHPTLSARPRIFDRGEVFIKMGRKSAGYVFRLAMPIMFLLCLVGLSFWTLDRAGRMDSTITVLITVSALYVIVFQAIPMLGYLTMLDSYILEMFVFMIFVVFVHGTVAKFQDKIDYRPMRKVYIRFIEMLGRVSIIPYVIVSYTNRFVHRVSSLAFLILLVVIFAIAVFSREYVGFQHELAITLREVEVILLDQENKKLLSTSDIMIFNYFTYREWFNSDRELHAKRLKSNADVEANGNGISMSPLGTKSS